MIVLIILLAIIALLLLVAAVSKKEMFVEKSIVIHQPKQKVFDYIRQVKNQNNFNVWTMMDPDMKKEYRGTDGTVGFVYYWHSDKKKNVGTGEQEIKKITEGESIDLELRFIKPRQDVARVRMTVSSQGPNQTLFTWSFLSTMKYPSNLMLGMISSMLGKALQQGTENLKAVLEKA